MTVSAPPEVLYGYPRREPKSLPQRLRPIRKYPLASVCVLVLVVIACSALFASVIAPYDPNAVYVGDPLVGPSSAHLMGTDNLGRDVFSRVVHGGRISLSIGVLATLLSAFLGTVVGTVSGYFAGKTDFVVQRFVDIWMSIPGLVLLITLAAALPRSIPSTTFVIGVIIAGGGSRIIRSSVLGVSKTPYVEAAQAAGASELRVMLRYILPNIAPIVIIIASSQLGVAVILEANVSFLGFGIPPPTATWGGMLSGQGRTFMFQAPLLAVWPGLAIGLVVFAFNIVGDSVRDVLDPFVSRGRGD